jgi:hypothetical protein
VHKQHIKLSAIDVGGDDHISLKWITKIHESAYE